MAKVNTKAMKIFKDALPGLAMGSTITVLGYPFDLVKDPLQAGTGMSFDDALQRPLHAKNYKSLPLNIGKNAFTWGLGSILTAKLGRSLAAKNTIDKVVKAKKSKPFLDMSRLRPKKPSKLF